METFEEAARRTTQELAEIVIRKQKDYGPRNITNSVITTELAIAVRLNDKIARLANLVQSGATPENESLLDTANDIMGYGLVLRMYLDGTFTLPMEETPVVKIKPSWKPEPGELEII